MSQIWGASRFPSSGGGGGWTVWLGSCHPRSPFSLPLLHGAGFVPCCIHICSSETIAALPPVSGGVYLSPLPPHQSKTTSRKRASLSKKYPSGASPIPARFKLVWDQRREGCTLAPVIHSIFASLMKSTTGLGENNCVCIFWALRSKSRFAEAFAEKITTICKC